MKNLTQKHQSIWTVDLQKLVYGLVGVVLYGLLSWSANIFPLPAVKDVTFRPAVAVLIFFGVAYGPWVGLLVGFLGNTFGDLLSDWGFLWNWSLGYGLIGMIAGLAAATIHNFRSPKAILKAIGWGALGIAVGMLFASVTQTLVSSVNLRTALLGFFRPFFIGNLVVTVILLPILMIAFAEVAGRPGR